MEESLPESRNSSALLFREQPPTLSLVQSYKCVGGCYPSRCNTNNHMTENIQGKRTRQREVPLPHGTGKAQGWKRENERRQEGARIHKQKRSGARWDAGSPSISCPPSRKKLQRLHNQLDKSASAPVASFPRSKSTTRTFTCALDRLLVKVSPWPRPESTGSSGWDDLQFKKKIIYNLLSQNTTQYFGIDNASRYGLLYPTHPILFSSTRNNRFVIL